jgi:hypothetical protein
MLFDIRKEIDALPPLSKHNIATTCKICGANSPLFDVVDFQKYCSLHSPFEFGHSGVPIEYFRCESCEFLFTSSFDDWSNDDFAKYIYNSDYIKVDPGYDGSRAVDNSSTLVDILKDCRGKRILDYGSGFGGLKEEFKKHDFHRMENYDPYSSPVKPEGKFDVIILMEVIEHTPWPTQALSAILEFLRDDGIILIGQTLQPHNINELRGNWWYLGPRNGHISTFSERTFITMAEQAGLRYARGGALYAFARGTLDRALQSAARNFQPIKLARLLADTTLNSHMLHGEERNALGSYRWSGAPSCLWTIDADDTHITAVEIPFCMGIVTHYAPKCRILIDGQQTNIVLVEKSPGGTFTFDLPPSSEPRTVELVMPDPISPRQLSIAPDDRLVGLAILTQAHFAEYA